MRSQKTVDAAGTAAKLDGLQAAVRREAEGAEADLFDDAMVAAVLGAAEALEAEVCAPAEVRRGSERRRGSSRASAMEAQRLIMRRTARSSERADIR